MSINRKRVMKWFWIWQDDKYEAWLNEMSRNGWHLEKVNYVTGIVFHFRKGEPKNFVYKLDYKQTGDSDFLDYVGIFKAAGWDYVCQDIAWKYFKREAVEGEDVDIYSDNESKILKYKNIINLTWILCLAEIIAATNLLFSRIVGYMGRSVGTFLSFLLEDKVFMVLMVLLILITGLLIYGIFKLKWKIKQLEKPLQEADSQKPSPGNSVMMKMIRGLLVVEIIAVVFTLIVGSVSIWEVTNERNSWNQITEMRFDSSNLKDLNIYQFITDGKKEIEFKVELYDFNFKKLFDLSIFDESGKRQQIIHGEQYWSNYNKVNPKYMLQKGKYKVILNVKDGNGKFEFFTKKSK